MVGKTKGRVLALYILAFTVLLIMVFPYIYMFLVSLAPWDEVDRKFILSEFTLRSYEWLFFGGEGVESRPWLRAFFNSFLVTSVSTFLMMVTAILVSYSLAKLKFRGRKMLNNVI